jgi:hypothetical protein
MRINWVVYAAQPAGAPGLRALRRQLSGRGTYAPTDILGPASALKELEAVCAGMLSGRGGPNVANRSSLSHDLRRALGQLGRETRAAAGKALLSFESELNSLNSRLETPQGARVMALTVGALLERLADETVVAASWHDAVAAFIDNETTAEVCELRLSQLAELAEHRGLDFERWAAHAEALIGDAPYAFAGTDEDVSEAVASGARLAGVSEQRRIELCEHALAELPSRSAVVVWLVIDHAAPLLQYQQVGPVELFDAALWPDTVRAGGTNADGDGWSSPPELADWERATPVFERLEARTPRAFARVSLDDSTPTKARDQARAVVQTLVDLADQDSDWVLLDQTVSWTDEGGWSGEAFREPQAAPRQPPQPVRDTTAMHLEDFDGEFVRRLLHGDVVSANAVDDALWIVAVERAPSTAQRIPLAIRAVERTLGQAREGPKDSWARPADRYLREVWVEYTLANELRDAGFVAYNAIERGGPQDLFRRLHPVVLPASNDPSPWLTFVHGFAGLAAEVLPNLAEGSMEHRLVREADAVLNSAAGARRRLGELRDRFETLLARTERQRNALTHGTGTTTAVLNHVDQFATILARYSAQEAMRQAETGKEPLVELERHRIRALEQDARLEVGHAPLDVFWPRQ